MYLQFLNPLFVQILILIRVNLLAQNAAPAYYYSRVEMLETIGLTRQLYNPIIMQMSTNAHIVIKPGCTIKEGNILGVIPLN